LGTPEEHGGLGLTEIDLVLPLEETGRAGLAEPVVESAAVAAPLLAEAGNEAAAKRWLPALAAGEAIATVAHDVNSFVADAHVADVLLAQSGGEIHAVERRDVVFELQTSIDPLRRLFTVTWRPRPETLLASGEHARALMETAL